MCQVAAFATGVPPDIYAFHRYTGNSTTLSHTLARPVRNAVFGLSPKISHHAWPAAYTRFTPSKSGSRLPPTYYRGCWHVVSRGFLGGYRLGLPLRQWFTYRNTSSHTRRCSVRLSPIAADSSLLPPVGVGAVSQSPCGWSSSQTSYPSSPW